MLSRRSRADGPADSRVSDRLALQYERASMMTAQITAAAEVQAILQRPGPGMGSTSASRFMCMSSQLRVTGRGDTHLFGELFPSKCSAFG